MAKRKKYPYRFHSYATSHYGDYKTKKRAKRIAEILGYRGKKTRISQLTNKQWRVNIYLEK